MIHNSRRPYQVIIHKHRCVSIDAQLSQDALHHFLAVGIQGTDRLIHDEDIRIHGQYGSNTYGLALSAGKISHTSVSQILKVQQIQNVLHTLHDFFLGKTQVFHSEGNGIFHTIAEQLVLRRLAHYADKGSLRYVKTPLKLPVADKLGNDLAEYLHQSGFTASAWPHNRRNLSLFYGKVHLFKDFFSIGSIFITDIVNYVIHLIFSSIFRFRSIGPHTEASGSSGRPVLCRRCLLSGCGYRKYRE